MAEQQLLKRKTIGTGVTVVKNYPDETIDHMLRRMKRKMKYNGIIVEMRKREYFERPGETKRRARRRKKTADGRAIT